MKSIFMVMLLGLGFSSIWQKYDLQDAKVSIEFPSAPVKDKNSQIIYNSADNDGYMYTVWTIENYKNLSFDCINMNSLDCYLYETMHSYGENNFRILSIMTIETSANVFKEVKYIDNYEKKTSYLINRIAFKNNRIYNFIIKTKENESIPDSISNKFFNSIHFME